MGWEVGKPPVGKGVTGEGVGCGVKHMAIPGNSI